MAKALPELRAWMKSRGIKQGNFAKALGLGEGQFSRIINNKEDMPLKQAFKASILTGISVDKLLTGGEAKKVLELYGERLTSGA